MPNLLGISTSRGGSSKICTSNHSFAGVYHLGGDSRREGWVEKRLFPGSTYPELPVWEFRCNPRNAQPSMLSLR